MASSNIGNVEALHMHQRAAKPCCNLLHKLNMSHWLVQSKNVVRCLDLIPDEEQKDRGYLVMEKYSHTLGYLLHQRKEHLLDDHGQPVAWFKEVSLPHHLSCTF